MNIAHKERLREFYEQLKKDPTLFNNDADFETVYKKIYWWKREGSPNVKSFQHERHMKEMFARASEMKTLYESGKTMKEIGLQYKISTERVRQILEKNFPGMPIRNRSLIQKEPKKCKACGKEFIPVNKFTLYCSIKCSSKGRRKYHTLEEWKERNRRVSHENYLREKERIVKDAEYAEKVRKQRSVVHKRWYDKHKRLK